MAHNLYIIATTFALRQPNLVGFTLNYPFFTRYYFLKLYVSQITKHSSKKNTLYWGFFIYNWLF